MKNEELGCAITPHGNSSFFVLHSSSFSFLSVEEHKVNSDNYEWDAKPLTHVECHPLFKANLVLFQELNEETEDKYLRQAKAEEETAMVIRLCGCLLGRSLSLFLLPAFIEINHSKEEDKVSDCLV